MRPKHALWLAAALVWFAWYAIDPQARFASIPIPIPAADCEPDRPLVSAAPTRSGDQRVQRIGIHAGSRTLKGWNIFATRPLPGR